MAAPSKTRSEVRQGFDVTCTVGRVEFDEYGPPPEVAAFVLIAEHGAPGEFRFPRPDGTVCIVSVAYAEPHEEPV